MQKILVVEDERAQRQFMQAVLLKHGYEVLTAENGAIGAELAKAHHPDIIVSDVHMSDGGGYDLLASVRNDPLTSTIPIILVTALADRKGMRQGMELGADDYLPKPFTQDELVAAINSRLQKHQQLIEKADKKLEELRATISVTLPHELRTPLNGILGYTDLMRKQAFDLEPSEVSRMSERIYKNAKRLQRLVENYLIYAQLELRTTDVHRKGLLAVGATEKTHEIVETIARNKAKDFGREADLDVQTNQATINISQDYFGKVVEEIVDNAFKFSKAGSPVHVEGVVGNEGYVVTVTDQGRGMTGPQLSEIGAYVQFERKFYEQQGSGLGLIVAKRLTELHGGGFTIHSEVGKGTSVILKLLQAES
ncbi:MAG: hybrid sensor histidine kinase/response regulator [Ignavibacteriales bacterium]|nr:hybrid sensor histidine kinase/response regulator [Ignavibacteriales bacterium]